ncbi:MAG TPA: PD-(D/E)XK nuclease family protein [Tepidisphaeraceae bacterium]|nr:PD-(D/E)XK nuclease family protein [Tepidisphaeraceae bacterium]
MAVRFVIGRAGSGKTHRCFSAIVEALRKDPFGPPVYWLLPRQATFTAERELTCLSGLDAFCRARVVSFDEFGRDVFEDCGGTSIPQVTAQGRTMILGHLLRQNRSKLRFFSRVARQPGLAAELDATFAEFERSGKTAEELGAFISDLSESNAADLELAPLLDKLHDTRLLYQAYTDFLGQDRLDQHRRSTQVQALLASCAFLRRSEIYVDGFVDFTEYERRILVGAAKAGAKMEISLRMNPDSLLLANPHTIPDEMSLFRRTEETYRKLHFALTGADVPLAEPVRLAEVRRFGPQALRDVESSLFRDPIKSSQDAAGIELIEASDDRAEVDAVARKIQDLLRGGMRLREIVVLVRNIEQYQVLIDSSFREHGIPYFVDRRRSATHHPLVQFVRSVFQIARNDWPHDAVMSLLRSGLARMDRFDADGLENYVLAHRIDGAAGWERPEPWGFRRKMVAPEDASPAVDSGPEKAEALRRPLVDRLLPIIQLLRQDEPLRVRQIAAEIFSLLDRFEVRQTLSKWVAESADAKQLEQSAEHEQVWTELVELFDQLVDLLGEQTMTPAEFQDVLEAGLDSFDLAIAPPTLDQVLVGQVDRTRTPPVKAAFVLGLNEGQFPRVPSDGSILTDRDRRNLRQRRIELDAGSQQRLLDERFLGYVALTRASQRLFVSRAMADKEGRSLEPSSFWRRLTSLFPHIEVEPAPADRTPTPERIATPRQFVTALMRWVRSSADPIADVADATWPAFYQWFATARNASDRVTLLRDRAWPALSYTNTAQLSPEIARAFFSPPLEASVSELETFASCPFRHYARNMLGLRERDRQDVTVQDLGRLYHDLLENALREVLKRRAQGDRTITLESAIDQFVEKLAGSIRDELMLGSARNRYLLDRTRKTLQRISRGQRELLKRGLFRPQHVGVTFGPGGKLPPLKVKTPSGAEALLRGKIDRIDRVESSDDAAVIDYRLGPGKLPVGMVLHGLSLQLVSYLLVLQSNGERLAGRKLDPAAAFYLQLIRKIEDVKHPGESVDPSDPKWHLAIKPRGIFDQRCLGALDRDFTSGQSEVVQAFIRQDGMLGRRNTSDVTESKEFREVLRLASAKLGDLADGILSGKIDIAPYRLNDSSPCSRCEYRSVCRFDPAINKYNYLKPISAEEVFAGGNANG